MEKMTYTFAGLTGLSEERYSLLLRLTHRSDGSRTCPFCSKPNLKDNFGSARKHLKHCAKIHNGSTYLEEISNAQKFLDGLTS